MSAAAVPVWATSEPRLMERGHDADAPHRLVAGLCDEGCNLTSSAPAWTVVRDRAYEILAARNVNPLAASSDVWAAACAEARRQLAVDRARARLRLAQQQRLERAAMTRNLGALVTELLSVLGRTEYSVAAERRVARLIELEGHTLDGLDSELDHRLSPKTVWQLGLPSFEEALS